MVVLIMRWKTRREKASDRCPFVKLRIECQLSAGTWFSDLFDLTETVDLSGRPAREPDWIYFSFVWWIRARVGVICGGGSTIYQRVR